MTIETPKHDIRPVQMLRGIAAMMVVFYHIGTQLSRQGYPGVWPWWLNAGVDIFFVISGFIMWVSTDAKPERTATQFMQDRIIRIVPLYWFLTTMMVVMMVVTPRLLQSALLDPGHIISSYIFLPYQHPNPKAAGALWPVVVPGWTLNYEMFFYVLFAVAIAIGGASRLKRFVYTFCLIVGAVVAGRLLYPKIPLAAFYADTIMLEFLMGLALGFLFVARNTNNRHWLWLTATGFVLLLIPITNELPRVVSFGLPALMIVSGAVFCGDLRITVLERLGDASYSLYLSHVVTLSALSQAWMIIGATTLPPIFFVLVAVGTSIAVAVMLYYSVERPLTRHTRALIRGGASQNKHKGG